MARGGGAARPDLRAPDAEIVQVTSSYKKDEALEQD